MLRLSRECVFSITWEAVFFIGKTKVEMASKLIELFSKKVIIVIPFCIITIGIRLYHQETS